MKVTCPHCGKSFDLKLKCTRCGYEWTPRYDKPPKVCPICKSPYWNKKRVRHIPKNKKAK